MSPAPHHFQVETTATGYSAFDEEHAVYTTGASLDALYANIKEALALLYEDEPECLEFEIVLAGLRVAAADA